MDYAYLNYPPTIARLQGALPLSNGGSNPNSSGGDVSKVLVLGDAGAHTGFARVTHNIYERLVREYGHDVHVLAVNHRGDYWDTPLKLYMASLNDGLDVFGQTRIAELLLQIEPEVVVFQNDPQVVIKMLFENKRDPDKLLLHYRPLITYMPLDGFNYPPAWDVIAKVSKRVAFTKFAQRTWTEAPVVYHGMDKNVFYPVDARHPVTLTNGEVIRSRAEAKKAFGYDPDGFLVLRVDRNSYRKNYPDTIKALWPFMTRHKDVQVHLHCEVRDSSGYHLGSMLSREPELHKRFYFPDNTDTFLGWPENNLCGLYNAADVFISTSWGEGFGLTLAEAAACGLPIIAQNVSAIPEVVGPGGILLEPEREQTVPSGEEQWLPNVGAFTEALEHLYVSGGVRRKLGAAGRDHVVKSFSWDFAAARFNDFIVELVNSDPRKE